MCELGFSCCELSRGCVIVEPVPAPASPSSDHVLVSVSLNPLHPGELVAVYKLVCLLLFLLFAHFIFWPHPCHVEVPRTRDRTCLIAATQAAAVTMPDP